MGKKKKNLSGTRLKC